MHSNYSSSIKIVSVVAAVLCAHTLIAQIVFTNWGEMVVGGGAEMYVDGSTLQGDAANILLDGRITLLGDFTNNVVSGNVFRSESVGTILFTGNTLQKINGSAQKDLNYVAFPNVDINKDAEYVELDAAMGADMKLLNLQKGKLLLRSEPLVGQPPAEISLHNSHVPVRMAHLRVNSVQYNRDVGLSADRKGVVEVEMALPDKLDRQNKIFGFVSPYKQVYSDYFIGNYLFRPNEVGLMGALQTSSKDPNINLEAGLGYLAGQNILPTNRYALDPTWGNVTNLHNARFQNMLTLNRYQLEVESNPIANVIPSANTSKYTEEELNTTDLTFNLANGWQFFGNPYTCPLDMGLLLDPTPSNTDSWGTVRTETGSGGIQNRYYVMAGGEGALDNWTPDRYTINPVWLVAQQVGSTVSREIDDQFVLAPMQMAAIYSNGNDAFTIPKSERTHGFSGKKLSPTNELLLEVADAAGGAFFDRLALVLVNGADTKATDNYDVRKTVDSLASPGQIFTQSSDGYAMITNVLPPTEKFVEMGMMPTLSLQNKMLTAHRLGSLAPGTQAWLEDRVAGGPWVDLMNTTGYSFDSKPGDRIDRFVIHLNVAANSQVVAPTPIPAGLYEYGGMSIPAASSIALKGTSPVGSIETDVIVDLASDLICNNGEAKVTIDASLTNVQYHAFDAFKGGTMKGSVDGNGGAVNLNAGTYGETSPQYFLDARSTDGLLTIDRRLPAGFSIAVSMIYPDLRVAYCGNTERDIHLSQYIDTTNFVSVQWTKLSGCGTLTGDVLNISTSDSCLTSLSYVVTDLCQTANTAKVYLSPYREGIMRHDTLVVCYNIAEALNLNQIFGLEGGTISADKPANLAPSFFTVSNAPQVFAGAVTFSAKAAYLQAGLLPNAPSKYGPDAKTADFIYTPASGSCLTKPNYRLVLVLTGTVPN